MQDGWGEAGGAVVVVAGGFLSDGDGLEVAAHQGGHLVGGEVDARVGGGIDWGDAVDPIEEGIDVELIVRDRVVHRCDGRRDFWEIADS